MIDVLPILYVFYVIRCVYRLCNLLTVLYRLAFILNARSTAAMRLIRFIEFPPSNKFNSE